MSQMTSTLNRQARLIYIPAVTAGRGLFAFSYLQASFEQKHSRVSASFAVILIGQSYSEPFSNVIAAAREHSKCTHATYHHILHHHVVSWSQPARLACREISHLPSVQGLNNHFNANNKLPWLGLEPRLLRIPAMAVYYLHLFPCVITWFISIIFF